MYGNRLNFFNRLHRRSVPQLAVLVFCGWLPWCLGCTQFQRPDDGTFDVDKFREFVRAAEESGATVRAILTFRPGYAGISTGPVWDTGIEGTFLFEWEGDDGTSQVRNERMVAEPEGS